ncbi:MAG: bifunctional UDP-N-acetylglucosamine diphosphorylase/glucosamine-1-phosphate N-acetyltransferase GlmU, partial [Oscillospiraceae bacterium]
MDNKCAIILAAGKGTRMKSDSPKVVCEVLFKPMVNWVVDACKAAGIKNICAVTGYKSEVVQNVLDKDVVCTLQAEQKGTGHAVMMAKDFLMQNIDGDVVVLNGDAPFIDAKTINDAYLLHKTENNAITVITAKLSDPTGYGRIVRRGGTIEKIVEQKDADEAELLVNEVNSGAYWFNVKSLLDVLSKITRDNSQGEYYLTDTVTLTLKFKKRVNAKISENPDVILGANSRKDLCELNDIARRKIIDTHFENGVEFVSLDGVIIAPDVKIGKGTKILPATIIKGQTKIAQSCTIGPNSVICDSNIASEVVINASQCYNSIVENNVKIGPFCHIRPNSHILSDVQIGDFVEIKNSTIGQGSHIPHLTYIGDSEVGKNVNFGCGVVTVNYDGTNKAGCKIGDNAFIGCNSNLVAPLDIGEGAYLAAGSTITDDVPSNALGIARARQLNKPDFAQKKLVGHMKKTL